MGAKSGAEQTAARMNREPSVQIGMPMGFDNGTIPAQATADKLASFYDYSQLDRTRLGKLDAPTFMVTAAQTQLLLAEAAQRGYRREADPEAAPEAAQRGYKREAEAEAAQRAYRRDAEPEPAQRGGRVLRRRHHQR